MSGQGVPGPIGPTGPTGINGRKGRQGLATGPTGLGFFSSAGVIPYTRITNTGQFSVTAATVGTHYLIDGNAFTEVTVVLPGDNVTAGAGMTRGSFWVFKNGVAGASTILTLNLLYGNASYYHGEPTVYSVQIGTGNSLTLAYSGTGISYIVL